MKDHLIKFAIIRENQSFSFRIANAATLQSVTQDQAKGE
jgi:hypothetical protein